jgi:class 3 adenylate cyclase
MKWLVYGLFVGVLPVLFASAAGIVNPELWGWNILAIGATGIIPICIFIAITRYQLFNIDRLISATATYTILGVILVAALLALAPRIAQAASASIGLDAATGQTAVSILLASLVVPAQRFLRPKVDRLFFAERQALETEFEQLLTDLSATTEPQALLSLAGERLEQLVRPERLVIYAKAGAVFAPVFSSGSATSPFETALDLLRRLEQRNTALLIEERGRASGEGPDASAGTAPPADLGAAVLLPIRHGDDLAAFVCLGRKRSGDVYINTDLALLTAVAQRISVQLQHFGIEDVRRQARAMQDSLKRYVPGAVAERLEHGQELEAQARDVTILFVDIRGYTSYSEGRSASEIFSMISRYTEAVSALIRQHGGTVVEFHGDGLMAIFGAPDALADKERAAVEAAREIVIGVRDLALGSGEAGTRPLAVGVGIATGEAFVGNIRSSERIIWGAIGNTTNLAARLQSMTRDLEVSVIIDAATQRAAGAAAGGFVAQGETTIRGLKEPIALFSLRT